MILSLIRNGLADAGDSERSTRLCRSASWGVFYLSLMVAGCGQQVELETEYGRRRGEGASSVNGTSVLAEMFREAGGRPTTIQRLSSSLNEYDVLVWVADDFQMPSEDARDFIEQWLGEGSGRTCIFVGRDYDASWDYWRAVISDAPAQERKEYLRRRAMARAEHCRFRMEMPREECSNWMVLRREYPGHRVKTLEGTWTRGIDMSNTQLWTQGRLEIPTEKELTTYWKGSPPNVFLQPEYTPLLTSGDNVLAYEITKMDWRDSRIIIVGNGSLLLNLPLVKHEHRRLTGRLIASCQPFLRVAFLEPPVPGWVSVGDLDAIDEDMKRKRVLLAFHWLFLGAIFCFSVYPIFGRPREGESEVVADFGQHVEAMAALLERTGDVEYARQQIEQYQRAKGGDKPSGPVAPAGRQDQPAASK